MPLAPGTRLGPFEILAPIGAGGMGEVYRARDARLKRDVAIKVLPAALARDPDRIARFKREARAVSALNHPNIVAVYDIGCENGVYWIASELVRGDTLRRAIEAGPLPPRKAIEIATQVAAGLAAAHAVGLVHRDLKPENIMVTPDGQAKILDFGLAKQRFPAPDSTTVDLTDEGAVLGTVGYMSPEQVRGKAADHRSDLFSFGVVFYEMLCGKRAFSGGSSVEVMNAILKDDPQELPPSVPPAFVSIARRCLEKEPDRRFQSAADLSFAVQSLALSPAGAPRPEPRAWWKWAALLAACAMAGMVYWLVGRSPRLPAAQETTLRRLTTDPGLTSDAAISPDGKLVAYVRNGDIWVRPVDAGGVIRITDDPADDRDPAFSPDGVQIAFHSEREGGGIYVASTMGGEARQLAPLGVRPRFSPDGRWLMYETKLSDFGAKVFVKPLGGGTDKQIGVGRPVLEKTAVWSPDGSRILFLAFGGAGVSPATWISSLDGKELKANRDLYTLSERFPVIDQWIADPPRLLALLKDADATSITAVPVSPDGTKTAGPYQRLTSLTDNVTRASAALNGRMALSVATDASHIWGLPIDAMGRATGEPRKLTDGSAGEDNPALSRDGGKLGFISRGGLFLKDLVTGRERELLEGRGCEGPVFTPDGAGIMCEQFPEGGSNSNSVSYLPLTGGPSKKILEKSFYYSMITDLAPGGKSLLTMDWDRGKKVKGIQQLDLDSLSTTMFLDDPVLGLWVANFSHDGRWVTFNAEDGKSSRIYVAPFRKAPVLRSEWIAITHGDWDDKPRFSFDDKLIFYVSSHDAPRRLMAQKLGSDMRPDGDPVVVYPRGNSKPSVAISYGDIRVGPHLIVFTQVEASGNIWLLEPAKRDR